MSEKLKIMQEPLVRQPVVVESVNEWDGGRLFYKVETCSVHTFYIEVMAWQGSLFEVIHRLKSDFDIDASGYCEGCETPVIQRIAIVTESDVPANHGALVFVSRLQ